MRKIDFSYMSVVKDTYGRSFKTLRVSLLNNCNLGCVYCTMGDSDIKEISASRKSSFSSVDFIRTIQKLHEVLGLEVVRLTGGEPLLYRELIAVIEGIAALGISEIKLTTNGFLLERFAKSLKEAGMKSINVSLDAIDEDVFFLMSKRNDVGRIIRGIDAAIASGLEVKLNVVLMKGINESQIIPLLKFAFERGINIRFLEVMAMGHLYKDANKHLVTREEILHTIAGQFDFTPLMRILQQRLVTGKRMKGTSSVSLQMRVHLSATIVIACV
jgi:cyclic pyranopterin phosphate synthase